NFMEMKMNKVKLFALPLLAAAVVMTGCASRKPAAEVQTGNLDTSGSTTVNTQGLSEDAALGAQNMADASSKGVTAENKAYLAKRVVHFNYDSSELSNDEDRKSTRLNSSHVKISYAVLCLKKQKHSPGPAADNR